MTARGIVIHRINALIIAFVVFSPLMLAAYPPDSDDVLPGWYLSGSASGSYEIRLESRFAYNGTACAYLGSIEEVSAPNFGTIMQWVDAQPYHGQRVKVAAFIKTSHVSTGAALWMRVDGSDGKILGFDNMSNRGLIRGSTNWSRFEAILDVPPESKRIAYGVLLKGTGSIWVDSVSVSAVYKHEAVTALPSVWPMLPVPPDDLPIVPRNVEFDDYFE